MFESLISVLTTAVTLASLLTRLTHTPEKPEDDAPALRRLWYQLYPLIEAAAFVGERTKQQPALASTLADAATIARTSGDAKAVAEMVEGVAAVLGRR